MVPREMLRRRLLALATLTCALFPRIGRAQRSGDAGEFSKWTCKVESSGQATLLCEQAGGAPFPVRLKGVCYSPAPVGGSNGFAPAIGDWYWDGFDSVSGWNALWRRDWPKLHDLGVNTLRVYCMLSRQLEANGGFPEPWNKAHLFTHRKFLDLCWGTRQSVLVGIPLPARMLWKNEYEKTSQAEKDYWTNVLRETAQSVGRHPGVLGFTLQNEQDGAAVCYDDPVLAGFWWGQVETMAAIVKQAAPDKLVGMATHDDPNIPRKAAAWMARCPHIDFWGVNTYQTETLDGLFADYAKLTGSSLKPVILTEWGIPATGHRDPANAGSIYDDAATQAKAAAGIARVVPQAYGHPLCLGLYYFEFCDERWNQPEAPNLFTWWGGPPAPGFPNGYWDNEGFGLYSVARGGGLPDDAPIWEGNGPKMPFDVHAERTALTSVLAKIFLAVK
jgi:hypothetical protein